MLDAEGQFVLGFVAYHLHKAIPIEPKQCARGADRLPKLFVKVCLGNGGVLVLVRIPLADPESRRAGKFASARDLAETRHAISQRRKWLALLDRFDVLINGR